MLDVCLCLCFFFKQKTAYEMRISDWSSDVCSSDLPRNCKCCPTRSTSLILALRQCTFFRLVRWEKIQRAAPLIPMVVCMARMIFILPTHRCFADPRWRSEEHTSELQSLMRISYAVFCLKKKKKYKCTQQTDSINSKR